MDLYTLTKGFLPNQSVADFTSVIWTERYSSTGDVQLVVPATQANVRKLVQGTFLGLRGTKEIMMLETHSIEDGLLTVTGSSLVKFFNERQAWFRNPDYTGDDPIAQEYSELATTAGHIISNAVYKTVINPDSLGFTGFWALAKLDTARDKIPGLELGKIDSNGTPKRLTIPLGPLYDGIQKLADEEGLGFKLYLQSATYSTSSYVLKFATYRGRNRTSEQIDHSLVRLTPKMDSLSDVKELTSISNYKNVFYVFYKNQVSTHYLDPALPIPQGFDRRAILIEAPDIFLESAHVLPFLKQVARNAIANHVYIQAIDGEVTQGIGYKFGTDYYLGDVIELEGYSGLLSKARVTEYIRSQDQFGDREYPTLAVIDPLETGYMPDLEPDPPGDEDDYGDGQDPDYDFDPTGLDDLDDPSGLDDLLDPSDSDYDPGLDPFGRDRDKPVDDPEHPDLDPDKEPVPDFDDEPDDGDDGPEPTNPPSTPTYIVTGYYPDQNNGEAIGYIETDETLSLGWKYTPEDPDPEAENYWQELIPMGWTRDHQKLIVRSDDSKTDTVLFPWREGYAFWLMTLDGKSPTKLTDTLSRDLITDGHRWKSPGVLQYGSDEEDYYWYLTSRDPYPYEWVYADGTYSTDAALTGHGVGLTNSGGGPVELFVSYGGPGEGKATIAEMARVVGVEDFPLHMRWSDIAGPYPSPNGEKLCLARGLMGPSPNWQIGGGFGTASGGTFTLTVGTFGNIATGSTYTTDPIPWNATAAQVWAAAIEIPLLSDPRDRGYPYNPWSSGSLPAQAIQIIFDAVPELGAWMSINNTNLTGGYLGGPGGFQMLPGSFGNRGNPKWYLCGYFGSDLEEIDLETKMSVFGGWSPDSSKLHAIVPSESGAHYCRWLNYDIATGEVSYPLDYSDEPLDSSGYGQLKGLPVFSPDSQKIVWVIRVGVGAGSKTLWIADADGSDPTQIYHQTVDDYTTDQDVLVIGYQISWSFDGTKIAIVDQRDEAPVWVITLADNTIEKRWPGSGWDNPDEQKWIYDIQNFEG